MSLTTEAWACRSWRAMGSTAEVVLFGPASEDLASWAVAEIERLEACWSRFRDDSELCALNRQAGRSVPVSVTLWTAIDAAARAWLATASGFDPTVLAALVSLGYDRTFTDVPTERELAAHPAPVAGFGQVGLDPVSRKVTLPTGVGLDLGGIGKGLAADLVVDELMARGARSVSVSMGGDVRVAGQGPHTDGCWLVPVLSPIDDVELGVFPLVDEALVQSTTCIRSWRAGGRLLHHLIDPRTGWPADSAVVAVVVTGPRAAEAEALAKASLVAGPTAGAALLEGAGLDGWFITADGRVRGTSRVAADLGGRPLTEPSS